MSKKYKITLSNETIDAITAKGYDPLSYLNSLIADITTETTKRKSLDILDKQHKKELETYDKGIKAINKVEEDKGK